MKFLSFRLFLYVAAFCGIALLLAIWKFAPLFRQQQHPELMAGVWNNGQASFIDNKFFDSMLGYSLIGAPYLRGFCPEQPIKYSHQQHIEKAGMQCQYCHFAVAKSSFPGMPAVDSCMGCHSYVKADSLEVKKLKEFWDTKKSIPWQLVSAVPRHVRFNHERHIKGGIACYMCHGQVGKMEVVERVSSFKMGFCVSCHRDRGASTDCSICHY